MNRKQQYVSLLFRLSSFERRYPVEYHSKSYQIKPRFAFSGKFNHSFIQQCVFKLFTSQAFIILRIIICPCNNFIKHLACFRVLTFFRKYFSFVERARAAGITVPIIPGIKPLKRLSQLNIIPKTFKVDIPEELAHEVAKCTTDAEVQRLGIEWCIQQCRELMAHGVPSIHFYTIGAVDSIREIAKQIY